jgi:exoribonuclease R
LVDGAYTLYPDYVSNYLASLLPNNVRYSETGIWLVEPDMTIVEDSFQLLKSTIKSRHRLTYEGADEIIGSKCHDGLGEMLTTLGTFALKQREKNKVKEVYRQQENVGSYNPNHESRLVDRLVSANIVQECSLLFGHSKARLAEMKGIPYIFRACDEQVKLDLDGSLLKKLSSDNQGCISRISAYYTNKPTKHCGLGYDVYCHGGSTARRSPDGQNQYIDEDLIFNPNPSDKMVYIWEERTKKLVEHFNEASQRIDAFSNQYNYLMGKKLIRRP